MVNPLEEQLRHNAWANRTVLDAFAKAPQVLEATCYDGDTVLSRLEHQIEVERAFLDVLRGNAQRPQAPQGLPALVEYDAESGLGLFQAAAEAGEGGLERPYFVPWWQAEMPAYVLLSQVLAHSAQHRSELAWELARAGVNTGELDFIRWYAGGQPAPGEPAVIEGEEDEG